MSTASDIAQCQAALDALQKEAIKLGKKALTPGAELVLAASRAAAPVASGATQANVMIRKGRSGDGRVNITVGVDVKDFTGPTFYAAFVLFGHRIGKRKLGDKRKLVPANDWLKRAFDASKQAAADSIIETWVQMMEAKATELGKAQAL